MAEFYVYNSLNPNKVVKCNITFRYFIIKGVKGEFVWTLEIGTTHVDSNGDAIIPQRVYSVSVANFDEMIEIALAKICAQIDWSPLSTDKAAPIVSSTLPLNGDTDVNIGQDVYFTIEDDLPSAGIDLSSMKVTLNNGVRDFDITSEISVEGDPYKYAFRWAPPKRVYSRY
jgi:hypothetical protein